MIKLTENELNELSSIMDKVEKETAKENKQNNFNLLVWFQLNYPELIEKMKQCNHHFDKINLNPYHLEGDVWSHTMLVYNYATNNNFSTEVQIAALLHDIGKIDARIVKDINTNTPKVAFFGHENYSTVNSIEILNKLSNEINFNYNRVLYLINCHSFFHNIGTVSNDIYSITKNEKLKINKMFNNNIEFYIDLVNLSISDNIGRFSLDNKNITLKIEFFRNFTLEKTKISKNKSKLPMAIMLSGLPGTGKSFFVKQFLKKNSNFVLLSSDELIMKKYPNLTYNEAYKKVIENNEFESIEKKLKENLQQTVKKGKNIIFDRTNLTKKGRNRWFNLISNKKYNKINLFFIADLKIIKERNLSRKGKELSNEVYKKMIKSYTLPTYQEDFDDIKIVNTMNNNYSKIIKKLSNELNLKNNLIIEK